MHDWAHTYINGGVFIVDSVSDHYAFAIEAGMLNISDLGFDVKYSFTHWDKDGKNRKSVKDALGSDYNISQLTAYYHFTPEALCKDVSLYAAGLHNHNARSTTDKKEDWGWYAGVTVGSVEVAGDWYFDMNYQWVQAQVVPDRDQGGITRGTQSYDARGQFKPKGGDQEMYGLGNFKGIEVQGGYALTDNWLLKGQFQASRIVNKDLGSFSGKNAYSKFQVTSIYAF